MQRMRDLDWLFLGVENDVSHMHLGAVAVFDGPAPRYGELARVMDMKLPALTPAGAVRAIRSRPAAVDHRRGL